MNKGDYILITPNEIRWYELEDLPNESWKPCYEFETEYLISNYSRVKSIPRNGTKKYGTIVKPQLKRDGYYQVYLYKHDKNYYKRVNQLMGLTFIPNPENKPIVNHKDNNSLNNCLYNLEWMTDEENRKHYYDNYWVSTNKGRGKIQPRSVVQLSLDGIVLNEFHSITDAAITVFGRKSKRGAISGVCSGKRTQTGGYCWKYKEEVVRSEQDTI